MKNLLLLVNVFTLSITGTKAQWVSNGPYGGDIKCLAKSGSNIFAGARPFNGNDGGIFLLTNSGASWTPVNTDLPANAWVRALAANGSDIFAGIDSGGVYLSTNNGGNWTAVNTGLPQNIYVTSFAISGSNIFVGSYSGAYMSSNDGANWTAVNTGLPINTYNQTLVLALAASGTSIFAGTANGIYLSNNNGGNWTPVNVGLLDSNISSFAINGSKIYAGTDDYTVNSGVYLSTNNGTSWTQILSNYYVTSLAVSSSNIFVGGLDDVYMSTDNGSDWTVPDNGLPEGGVVATSLAITGSTIFMGAEDNGVWQQSLSDISAVIQVSPPPSPTQFKLYPNPATAGNWQLTVDNSLLGSALEIYDDNGRLVFQSEIRNSQSEINLNVAVGIYFASIKNTEGLVTQKLVVTRQ
jgi:photosystem II stability/assembly factor-like uncharacterized protein